MKMYIHRMQWPCQQNHPLPTSFAYWSARKGTIPSTETQYLRIKRKLMLAHRLYIHEWKMYICTRQKKYECVLYQSFCLSKVELHCHRLSTWYAPQPMTVHNFYEMVHRLVFSVYRHCLVQRINQANIGTECWYNACPFIKTTQGLEREDRERKEKRWMNEWTENSIRRNL